MTPDAHDCTWGAACARRRVVAAIGCMAAVLAGHAAAEPTPSEARAFLAAHCLGCHDASSSSGGVTLDFTEVSWENRDTTALLERVHRALTKGDMPPKTERRPTEPELRPFVAWLDGGLTGKTPRLGTPLRRLSRIEYARTIEQVFGKRFELPPSFPDDTRGHGFDNVAEALTLSAALLESYAECGTMVADEIFPPPKPPLPPARKFAARMSDMSSGNNSYGPTTLLVGGAMRLALRKEASYPTKFEAKVSATYRIRVKARAIRPEPGRPITLAVNSGGKEIKRLSLPETGDLDETFETALHPGCSVEFVYADAPNAMIDSNFPHPTFREDILHRFRQQPRLLAAWLSIHDEAEGKDGKTITTAKGSVGVDSETAKVAIIKNIEAAVQRTDLDLAVATPEAAEHLFKVMIGTDQGAATINKGFFQRYAEALNRQAFTECASIDLLAVEVEGPLAAVDNELDISRRQLRAQFLDNVIPADPQDQTAMRRAAETMLAKLFRRPATDGEAIAYAAMGIDHAAAGHSLNHALHLMLRTALISPHFIYREHGDGSFGAHDLASRLAYMLTVRPPDARLLAAAADGSLLTPATLRAEAERLLKTPDATFFVAHFAHQWLGTRLLPAISPDPLLGPFGSWHLAGLTEEIEMTLTEVLAKNLPLTDLIDPDFAFTNAVVGVDMYGFDKEWAAEMNRWKGRGRTFRVQVERGGRMGGLLGMAAVMMATANGVDTQPVVRGKWVLENILGDPTPPPPPSVPAITPDTRGAKTIRDLMAAHTTEETCAGCHRKLDPLGFVLENYDAIGKWRDTYPVHVTDSSGKLTSKPGPPVDAAAIMPDGTPLANVTDLKRYVRDHIDMFAGCVAEKIFIYGSGRVPNYAERKELHAVAANVLAEKGGLRDLLLGVIDTEAFRTR